ncbi:MAG: transcriptional repressor [Chloroflexota bacterium]|nr:transcriptional repressor [Chloroflexota bacterium]
METRRGRRRGRPASASFREQAQRALRSDGHRMTQQREILLDVIEHAGEHLDADGLYRLARERDRRISLSTVYRTLALLKQHDLVEELHLSEEHHHYEARSTVRHYHLVCIVCGRVEEFGSEGVERLREQLRRDRGFQVSSIDLDISGRCAGCVASAA